jgi:hypothetical protein
MCFAISHVAVIEFQIAVGFPLASLHWSEMSAVRSEHLISSVMRLREGTYEFTHE